MTLMSASISLSYPLQKYSSYSQNKVKMPAIDTSKKRREQNHERRSVYIHSHASYPFPICLSQVSVSDKADWSEYMIYHKGRRIRILRTRLVRNIISNVLKPIDASIVSIKRYFVNYIARIYHFETWQTKTTLYGQYGFAGRLFC